MKLFDEVLSDKIELPSLDEYLHNHTIVNVSNFSLSEQSNDEYRDVKGSGNDRYLQAYDTILKNKETFNEDNGFSVLKEIAQHCLIKCLESRSLTFRFVQVRDL